MPTVATVNRVARKCASSARGTFRKHKRRLIVVQRKSPPSPQHPIKFVAEQNVDLCYLLCHLEIQQKTTGDLQPEQQPVGVVVR